MYYEGDIFEDGRQKELTDSFIMRLSSLDLSVRIKTVQRILETISPADAVLILDALLQRSSMGNQAVMDLMGPVVFAVSELGELDAASAIYSEARENHMDRVCRLFMRPPPARIFEPAKEQGVDLEMRSETLGMRRQLARTANSEIMVRLQTDPDPVVISNLLDHPRMTENIVIRMAARRPARPEILMEIFRNLKWGQRLSVRHALANNPYSPSGIALKLVFLMPLSILRELAGDTNLHPEVIKAAKARAAEIMIKMKIAEQAENLAELSTDGEA